MNLSKFVKSFSLENNIPIGVLLLVDYAVTLEDKGISVLEYLSDMNIDYEPLIRLGFLEYISESNTYKVVQPIFEEEEELINLITNKLPSKSELGAVIIPASRSSEELRKRAQSKLKREYSLTDLDLIIEVIKEYYSASEFKTNVYNYIISDAFSADMRVAKTSLKKKVDKLG